ncbi:MAG: glycosyl hydrolase family 65 protein [Candidatus Omnitrophota bacterium]
MKSRFSKYLADESWLITEDGYSPRRLKVKESLFTLGNGYIGSRGIYEEIPDGTEAGTYVAGVYDKAASMVTELVNAPNPIDFRIAVEGEKLDISRMDILENRRTLDLRNGVLARRTVFSDTKKRKFLYESLRFFSLRDPHIGAMQVYLKAMDKAARIIVQDTVDDSVTNPGDILEGRKRHTQLVDVSATEDMNYLCVKTFTKKIRMAYASFLAVKRGVGQGVGTLNKIFNMSLKRGETVCFTKIFSIHTSRHITHERLKRIAVKDLRWAKDLGFTVLLERHQDAWRERWKTADIKIAGDKEAQKALRFNMYHLLIAGKEGDGNVSIGAKTLSGHGYRGHVFWDTEIFILPFFIYTNPEVARNLLMYRFHRLDEARRIAKAKGYEGTLFPWESADTGEETTPPYAKNLDGSIIEIHTGDMEHHIVSDIAYGVSHYFNTTGDVDFMLKAGLEIVLESARFWASRVTRRRKKKKFDINGVIGPDEFHENVNNNAYTNKMAQWNLRKAKELYERFKKRRPRAFRRIARKISLKDKETENWLHVAENIKFPFSKSKGIIEEFDGYFRKKDIILKKFNHYFMPILPHEISLSDIKKTQLVKQADVVMLMYLLPENFREIQKAENYLYYIKRTLHKSSLSPSVHSIIASEIKDRTRSYLYFLFSLYADLKNTHSNSGDGIHAASLGGTWQAVVMGFAGGRNIENLPSFEPRLPGHWRNIKFCLKWRNCILRISAGNKRIKIFAESRKKGSVLIKCFNSVYKVPFNKTHIFYNNKGKR